MSNTHETLANSETERRAIIVMVCEVVIGKRTLLNTVLGWLNAQTRVAYLFDTEVDFDTLLSGALVDLGASRAEEFLPQWEEEINRLEQFAFGGLNAGKNMVMIVSEAQKLDTECLEALRLMSKLETLKFKLIQISISDQPEQGQKLPDPQLTQPAPRISPGRKISPLDETGSYAYTQHRLEAAERRGPSPEHTQAGSAGSHARKPARRLFQPAFGIAFCASIVLALVTILALHFGLDPIRIFDDGSTLKDEKATHAPIRKAVEPQHLSEKSVHNLTADVPGKEQAETAGQAAGGEVPAAVSEPESAPSTAEIDDMAKFPEPDMPAKLEDTHEFKEPAVLAHPLDPFEDQSKAWAGHHKVPHTKREAKVTEQRAAAIEPEFQSPAHETYLLAVAVERGDILSKIMARVYGRYDETMLPAVLAENPHLIGPDQIEVGQVVLLPATASQAAEIEPEYQPLAPGNFLRAVVVQRGDSLSKIMAHAYGRYDETMLPAVLAENPHLTGPNQLEVGLVIQLPVAEGKK